MKKTAKWMLISVLALAMILVSCAQGKNITRDETVLEEQASDESVDALGFGDDTGLEPDPGFDGDQTQTGSTYLTSTDSTLTGNASWYGRQFQGRRTASGETFDMYQFTAAHRTYPFGTVLMVKNLDNNKEVRVRVNDRGPFRDDRIIDVSYAAGRELGMLESGVARVSLQVVSGGSEVTGTSAPVSDPYEDDYTTVAPPVSSGAYMLQCGAFYSRRNAEKLQEQLQSVVENATTIVQDGDYFKVRVINIATESEAREIKRRLQAENIPGYILKNE